MGRQPTDRQCSPAASGSSLEHPGKQLLSLKGQMWIRSRMTGNWYFIVFGMIENDGLFLDINNVRQAQNQLTTNAPNSNAPLSLSNGLGGSLNASIDELGFWDRSLDSTEKEWLYNTGAGRAFPL